MFKPLTKTQPPKRIGKDDTPRPLAGTPAERAAEIARRFPELARRTPITTTIPKG
jgi:hypothetical protein